MVIGSNCILTYKNARLKVNSLEVKAVSTKTYNLPFDRFIESEATDWEVFFGFAKPQSVGCLMVKHDYSVSIACDHSLLHYGV